MSYFGFVPSEALLKSIQYGIEKKDSNEALYLLRDQAALLINDEIIDAILIELVRRFPASDKRETAQKLAGYIKSTVAVLLKQLLSKAPNDIAKQSIEFSERSLFKDQQGQYRVGAPLDSVLVNNLKNSYAEIKSGNNINRTVLSEHYKQFAEAIVRYFMNDFNKTLDLGLIKRKASDLASSAVIKAVHLAIDKMIPNFTKEELSAVAEYHDTLFIE